MAGRVVLQMDQTTPAHQIILWYLREFRQKPDMDCYLSVRARGHYQETPQPQGRSLHNSTDSEPDPIRESIVETHTYGRRLHNGRPH